MPRQKTGSRFKYQSSQRSISPASATRRRPRGLKRWAIFCRPRNTGLDIALTETRSPRKSLSQALKSCPGTFLLHTEFFAARKGVPFQDIGISVRARASSVSEGGGGSESNRHGGGDGHGRDWLATIARSRRGSAGVMRRQ